MATIKDIAAMANVSISTVSHVVNKTRYVSPELEERVQKAIEKLDYPPNFIVKKSRPTSKNDKQVIVFLHGSGESYFGHTLETDIEEALLSTPYSLVCVQLSGKEKFENLERILLQSGLAAGLLVYPGDEGRMLAPLLENYHIPTVFVSKPLSGPVADYVYSDTEDGTYRAVRHLINSGHERIAYLSGSSLEETGRYQGYCRAMEEYNLQVDPQLVLVGLDSQDRVLAAMSRLFDQKVPPTALFAATYNVCAPVFQYMSRNNIECPKDLSVVCFNDFEWAALHSPPITAVRQDAKSAAEKAVALLMQRLENQAEDWQPQEVVLPTKLLIRSSTSGIAHGPFGEKAGSVDSLVLTTDECTLVAQQGYTAAISFHYTGKAWMDLLLKGISAVFRTLNISLIATTDAHFNPELQSRQLNSLRLLEPDVLISMPTDNTKTAEAFQQIVQSKVKLILITNVPSGLAPADYVSCVSVNERSHGRNIGHGLGEYMTDHGMTQVALLQHSVDFYATNQRDSAARQVLQEEYEGLHICASAGFAREEDVYEATLRLFQEHPEIEALYISWEGPAIEAMRALADMDRGHIAIATGDLDYNTALVMANGGMIKAISAQCPYEQGEAIAWAAANSLLGKTTPSFIGIEPRMVTQKNLLKTWKDIYKEEPPAQLKEALRGNPNFVY